jgi:hypothetical protein
MWGQDQLKPPARPRLWERAPFRGAAAAIATIVALTVLLLA